MTRAQRKALEWVGPGDEWKTDAGRLVQALSSAEYEKLVEARWGDFGARGGRKLGWRITDKGRAALEEISR